MSIPTPPEGLLLDAHAIEADQAAQLAALPDDVVNIIAQLPYYAGTSLVRRLSEYMALNNKDDTLNWVSALGQIAGRIGAALERDEVSGEQYRLLMDYVKGMR